MIDADIFSINKNILLCIVDYYNKFHIMKKAGGLSADDLIKAVRIVFTEFRPPQNIV